MTCEGLAQMDWQKPCSVALFLKCMPSKYTTRGRCRSSGLGITTRSPEDGDVELLGPFESGIRSPSGPELTSGDFNSESVVAGIVFVPVPLSKVPCPAEVSVCDGGRYWKSSGTGSDRC